MIEIKNLTKTFAIEGGSVEALKDVSITIPDGDIFGVIGMSGAGKSTLVRCINMLERPDEGSVIIDGVDVGKLTDKELRSFRRDITMIFQGFNLLMQKTCLKNICFPLELEGVKKNEAEARAKELLALVGLADKAYAYPAQLSGGQQQRIAIARALATNPKVLLCDEATSALDPSTTSSILELIRKINEEMGITVIVITHQMNVVESICKHVAILDGGKVAEQGEVGEVFSHPKTTAAKRLVFPEMVDENSILIGSGERLIRVVFNGAEAAKKPLIADMSKNHNIEANIAYASTKGIGGKAYGAMLLSIVGGDEMVEEALKYLNSVENIIAEEVEIDGR